MGSTSASPLDCWNSHYISFKCQSICHSWICREFSIESIDWVLDSNRVEWWYGQLNSAVWELSPLVDSSMDLRRSWDGDITLGGGTSMGVDAGGY